MACDFSRIGAANAADTVVAGGFECGGPAPAIPVPTKLRCASSTTADKPSTQVEVAAAMVLTALELVKSMGGD